MVLEVSLDGHSGKLVDTAAAFETHSAVQHFVRGYQVAHAHAGSQYLGERTHVNHLAAVVQGMERGDVLAIEAQVHVAIVFENREGEPAGDIQHL